VKDGSLLGFQERAGLRRRKEEEVKGVERNIER
jgi:hypothetical protein